MGRRFCVYMGKWRSGVGNGDGLIGHNVDLGRVLGST